MDVISATGELAITMPKDWSLEVQNKALRMSVRTLMENLTVEGEFKLELGEKDLPKSCQAAS